MILRRFKMNRMQITNGRRTLRVLLTCCLVAAALVVSVAVAPPSIRAAGSDHVRWDIINLAFTTPPTVSAGGVAFASADASHTIKLTGSGTFVAPASGGTSGAVTGGGTWETFLDGVSTGNGTYIVTKLASWQFSNFQPPNPNDHIDDGKATSANAVFRIQYSDGSEGIL